MSNERLKQELEKEIARVEAMRDSLSGTISRLKALCEGISAQPCAGSIHGASSEPKSQFLRIAEALISKGNRPRTARWIVKETGIARSSLSQILHRTHKDFFVSTLMPGYTRKKLWSLSEAGVSAGQLGNLGQQTLFGIEGEFSGVKGTDCCAQILRDHGNEPMGALTLARVAISRGYRGKAHGSDDEILQTTTKSFWAALSRDSRFEEVRPLVFALTEAANKAPRPPGAKDK